MLLSTSELNRALMSSLGERSVPASLFASAIEYHVLATSAPLKSDASVTAPALPSTPLVESQGVSGSKLAATRIVTLSGRYAPQMRPAAVNTLMRCWPSVVPGLPPIGDTGVGSLKPSPAPSRLTRTKLAAWAEVEKRSAAPRARRMRRMLFLLPDGCRQEFPGRGRVGSAVRDEAAARVAPCDRVRLELPVEVNDLAAAREALRL